MEDRRLVASAKSLATVRSNKSATGNRENETEIRKRIAIETATGTATETGKRTETEIMTAIVNATVTETVIGIETANETVNVIATVIVTGTGNVFRGTTGAMTCAAHHATTDVSANGNGKVTRHETAVTAIETDTGHGDQVPDETTRNDVPGGRTKIVVVMTNHETNGRQKMRSGARKYVGVF